MATPPLTSGCRQMRHCENGLAKHAVAESVGESMKGREWLAARESLAKIRR